MVSLCLAMLSKSAKMRQLSDTDQVASIQESFYLRFTEYIYAFRIICGCGQNKDAYYARNFAYFFFIFQVLMFNLNKQPKNLGSVFFVTNRCRTHFRTAPEIVSSHISVSYNCYKFCFHHQYPLVNPSIHPVFVR